MALTNVPAASSTLSHSSTSTSHYHVSNTASTTHPNPPPLTITLSLRNLLIHPIQIHLYPTYFTLTHNYGSNNGNNASGGNAMASSKTSMISQQQHHSYHDFENPLCEFIQCILQKQLPLCAAGLFEDSDWFEGKVHFEVYDHRITLGMATPPSPPILTKFSLSPSMDFIRQELELIPALASLASADSNAASAMMMQLESTILPIVCPLDLSIPLPRTRPPRRPEQGWGSQRGEKRKINPLNPEEKMHVSRRFKKTAYTVIGSDPYMSAQTSVLDSPSAPLRHPPSHPNFNPTFNFLSFVQEWRHKQTLAAQETMLPVTASDKRRRKSAATSASTLNKERIIRSLSFLSKTGGTPMYTMLNIVESPALSSASAKGPTTNATKSSSNSATTLYDGILRWGTSEGGGQGGMQRYPIGNKIAVEYYIGHFKGFYGMNHTLVSDSAKSTNPAAQSAAGGISTGTTGNQIS